MAYSVSGMEDPVLSSDRQEISILLTQMAVFPTPVAPRAFGPALRSSMPDIKALDAIDRRILQIVQLDTSLAIGEIAHRVGLSQTPCWKRLQRLEADGYIKRRVAILDQAKLGLGITVFVAIEVGEHSADTQARFATDVAAMREVLDFYRMAGDVDYMLRVVVSDTAAYDGFYKRLTALAPLKSVKSRFALEGIKTETALPIAT